MEHIPTILKQLCTILSFDEKRQETMLKYYDTLVLQEFSTVLVQTLKKDDKNAPYLKLLLTQIEQLNKEVPQEAVERIIEYILTTVPQQDRDKVFLDARLKVFLEIVNMLLKDASDEERVQITQTIEKHEDLRTILLGK